MPNFTKAFDHFYIYIYICKREGRDRGVAEKTEIERGEDGDVKDDAAPVREHVVKLTHHGTS